MLFIQGYPILTIEPTLDYLEWALLFAFKNGYVILFAKKRFYMGVSPPVVTELSNYII
jgi:hypothetical protein